MISCRCAPVKDVRHKRLAQRLYVTKYGIKIRCKPLGRKGEPFWTFKSLTTIPQNLQRNYINKTHTTSERHAPKSFGIRKTGVPPDQTRPGRTPVMRHRSDGNSRTRVNTSPALTAPCWPPCGRCGPLLKKRKTEPEAVQPFALPMAGTPAAPGTG